MSRKHGGRIRGEPEQFKKASRNQQRAYFAKLREEGKIRTKTGKVRKESNISKWVKEKKASRPVPTWMKKRTEQLLGENKKAFTFFNKAALIAADRDPWNPAAVGKITEYEDEVDRLASLTGPMKKRKRRLIEAGAYAKEQKESIEDLRKKLAKKGLKFDPWTSEQANRERLERESIKLGELESRAERRFNRLAEKASPLRAEQLKIVEKRQSMLDKFLAHMTGQDKAKEAGRLTLSERELQKKLAASPLQSQQDIAKLLENLDTVSQTEYPPTKTEELEKKGFFVIPPVRKRTGSDITGLEKRQYLNLYGPDRLVIKAPVSKKDKFLLGIPLTKAWTKTVDVASDPKLVKGFKEHEDELYRNILAQYELGGTRPKKLDLAYKKEELFGKTKQQFHGKPEDKIEVIPPRKLVEDKIASLRKSYKAERFEENPWEETARPAKAFSWSKPERPVGLSDDAFLQSMREAHNQEEKDRELEILKFLHGRSHPEIIAALKQKAQQNKPEIKMHRLFLKQTKKKFADIKKQRAKVEAELAKRVLTEKQKEYKQKQKEYEDAPKWRKFLTKLTQLT